MTKNWRTDNNTKWEKKEEKERKTDRRKKVGRNLRFPDITRLLADWLIFLSVMAAIFHLPRNPQVLMWKKCMIFSSISPLILAMLPLQYRSNRSHWCLQSTYNHMEKTDQIWLWIYYIEQTLRITEKHCYTGWFITKS